MPATFQVSKRQEAADWWWICVDDRDKVLFTSPISFEHQIQAFTEVNRIRGLLDTPTKVELITKTDIEHKLI